MKWLLIAIGGALGSTARYGVGLTVQQWFGDRWPVGTFVVNLSGCFFIGFFLTLASERITLNPGWHYLVPVGFVGAYTTFSTFEYETFRLLQLGAGLRALSYVLASVIAGFFAVWLAALAVRRF